MTGFCVTIGRMEEQTWKRSVTLWAAAQNAWRGIVEGARREWKLKIAAGFAAGALVASWLLNLSSLALGLVLFICSTIIAAEMLNSALETILDSVFPQYHEGVRQAKDLAAGAVLVLSLTAAVVGFILFLPPLLGLIF